jgi:SAM-dependent methyltransferase
MPENEPRLISSQEQFGRQARYYVNSAAHREGESLEVVIEWASRARYRQAVDIATGVGFTAFAIAPYAENVLATDITPAMLYEAAQIASNRGLTNVRCALAAAEDLPFADSSVDLVTCRTAAHHFEDLPKAVAEWRRVLAPDGVLILADTVCPEDRTVATWMNDIEARRDPSHVRDLSPSEWRSLLEAHNLCVTDSALTPVPLEFGDWVRRSGTPVHVAHKLRKDFSQASPSVTATFGINETDEGTIPFHWDCLVLRAVPQD